MKERIVIEKELLEKIIKALPVQWFDNKEKTDKLVLFGKEYKVEKYPTSWEELKELCKELEGKKIITTSTGIIIEDDCIEFHGLQFWKLGTISHETEIDEGLAIRLNRTPSQMWQIIKNLIGE